LQAGLQIMVRSGSDGIKGPEDLPGKRIGTAPGSTASAFLRTIDAQIHEFATIKYAAFALRDNNVDAIVYDAPVLLHYAAHAGRGRVQVIGPLLQKEDYGIVFPQGSPLRKQVNDTLKFFREDGTYRKLHTKWFAN
jgi:polar amino acid transport system substrate-binding protein